MNMTFLVGGTDVVGEGMARALTEESQQQQMQSGPSAAQRQ
jgi:hypothetical protein